MSQLPLYLSTNALLVAALLDDDPAFIDTLSSTLLPDAVTTVLSFILSFSNYSDSSRYRTGGCDEAFAQSVRMVGIASGRFQMSRSQ